MFSSVCNSIDYKKFQDDINRLFNWTKNWQMSFNIDKCKIMHIGRHNKLYDYSLGGQLLTSVSEEKDLGVIISKDLKVSQQCAAAYSKASKILGLINRSVVYKTSEVMLRLYKSVVRPHLEFCIVAWSPYYQKDKDLLERIQRRFTKMIPELRDLPYTKRLDRLKLWTLEERRIRADLLEVFKMIHGFTNVKFESFFQFDINTRTRGHSYKLQKSRFNKDLRRYFFSDRIINTWNSLDDQTVSASTVNSFKKNLDKFRTTRRWVNIWTDVSRP